MNGKLQNWGKTRDFVVKPRPDAIEKEFAKADKAEKERLRLEELRQK